MIDPWLPIGFLLPDGSKAGPSLFAGSGWQIVETSSLSNALIADTILTQRWISESVIDGNVFEKFVFGKVPLFCLSSAEGAVLAPVNDCRSPNSQADAYAFAQAIGLTRKANVTASLSDGIFVERYSRVLPSYSELVDNRLDDGEVLGRWLTGGLPINAGDFSVLARVVTWLDRRSLKDIVASASIAVREEALSGLGGPKGSLTKGDGEQLVDGAAAFQVKGKFSLPGRIELETFFNDHIVDIIQNRERYRLLGIEVPPAIILNGPPGCGKTFAVERLVEFLGWPNFEIDASNIASPYIHDTSRKIGEVFDAAIRAAPSVVVIDEMEAFVGDRSGEGGSHSHRLEELAEFLRRIPEATRTGVLVIGMTNRIDLIDPAILRRGRFDHVLDVGFASEAEISMMLHHMAKSLPKAPDVDLLYLAKLLAGRPLSDVSFVLREGARLAAKSGQAQLTQGFLLDALGSARPRVQHETRRIGF